MTKKIIYGKTIATHFLVVTQSLRNPGLEYRLDLTRLHKETIKD